MLATTKKLIIFRYYQYISISFPIISYEKIKKDGFYKKIHKSDILKKEEQVSKQ